MIRMTRMPFFGVKKLLPWHKVPRDQRLFLAKFQWLGKVYTFLHHKKIGFTLVELLISVAVLGFGLVTVIQSYASILRGYASSRNYFEAVNLALAKITELELSAYEKEGLIAGEESRTEELQVGSRQGSLSREVKEVVEPDYLAGEMVELCVKLNWQERNTSKEIGMAMYLPKRKEVP